MSEKTEHNEEYEAIERGEVIEGGVVEDSPPIDEKHRTKASPVQRIYEGIIRDIDERLDIFRRRRQVGGTVDPWEPPDTQRQ